MTEVLKSRDLKIYTFIHIYKYTFANLILNWIAMRVSNFYANSNEKLSEKTCCWEIKRNETTKPNLHIYKRGTCLTSTPLPPLKLPAGKYCWQLLMLIAFEMRYNATLFGNTTTITFKWLYNRCLYYVCMCLLLVASKLLANRAESNFNEIANRHRFYAILHTHATKLHAHCLRRQFAL